MKGRFAGLVLALAWLGWNLPVPGGAGHADEQGRTGRVPGEAPGADAAIRTHPVLAAADSRTKARGGRAAIWEIQGAGHVSPHLGARVRTSGIVTAATANGFYLQDPAGDGDDRTSDGIFVDTRKKPGVAAGDAVSVSGKVGEYVPGGARTDNLSVTQIGGSPSVTVISSRNPLPHPVVVGASGRRPPAEIIDDDRFTRFDPESDGIDFHESLESMRVTVAAALALAPTTRFGEIYVVADLGAGASGINPRGGLTLSPGDFNPERLQIDDSLMPGSMPEVDTGDRLGDVTGVVGYRFGNFEVLPAASPTPVSGSLEPESATLRGDAGHLLVASFNLLNLDPNDGDGEADVADGRFAALAGQIVGSLNSPDILALQEVQDDSGSDDDGTTAAGRTLRTLTEVIAGAGGPAYSAIDNPPADGKDGGQPGGNIRVAFLYNAERVELAGRPLRLEDADGEDAFEDARKPLQAAFEFDGERIVLINNHFTSRGGSSPLFGRLQPPAIGGLEKREAQAAFLKAHVDGLLAADPEARILLLGDF
ncbi:MAG: endonuclease, partial [Gemmatimonadetes bacterium]|nr:endonuclease [Gemmatimonadota bacterium]